jgi:hypothetical protein
MNNIAHINQSSRFMLNQVSLPVALRWLRRVIAVALVVANLAITLWATAHP